MSDFPWIKRLGGYVFKDPSTLRIRTLVSWPVKLPVCVSGLSGNAVVRVGMQSLPQQIPHGKSKSSSQIHKQKITLLCTLGFPNSQTKSKWNCFFSLWVKNILEKEQCNLSWVILKNCALKPKKIILCIS